MVNAIETLEIILKTLFLELKTPLIIMAEHYYQLQAFISIEGVNKLSHHLKPNKNKNKKIYLFPHPLSYHYEPFLVTFFN